MINSNDFVIQLAVRNDLSKIINFLSAPEIDQAFNLPLTQRAIPIPEMVHDEFANGFWLIALYRGELIACRGCSGIIDQENSIVKLATMAVNPSFRKMGIGRKLLAECVRTVIKLYNPRSIVVNSFEHNKGIETIALASGFVKNRIFDDPSRRPPGVKTVEYILTLPRVSAEV